MLFPKEINAKWIQLATAEIWTRFADSVFHADNRYATSLLQLYFFIIQYFFLIFLILYIIILLYTIYCHL